MRLTYLIGEPGVGKTTLLNAFTEGLSGMTVPRPFARRLYDCGVVQLGEERAVFGGTDTLSMSVQPKVLGWAEMPEYPDVIAEGDRLANGKFFQGMRDLGYNLCIVHCIAPSEVIAERRLMRAAQHEVKPQDPIWLKGRETKVHKLAEEWATHRLDTSQPGLGITATDLGDQSESEFATLPVIDILWEARP